MKKLVFIMPLMAISLLASCGSNTKSYHIKFTNGNKVVKESDYKENETIVAPKDPDPYEDEEEHKIYTFNGWYDGNTKFVNGTKATKDVEYIAKFNCDDIKYTVTFMNEGEEFAKITDAKYGDVITAPENEPTKTDKKYNYEFDDWYYEGTDTPLKEGDKVEGTTILEARYTKKDPIVYNVKFVDGSGTVDTKQISVNSLTIAATPAHTTTTYYDGVWKEGDNEVNAGDSLTFSEAQLGNHTFTWTETVHQYDVKFNYVDGTTVTNTISLSSLELKAPKTKETPQDVGHRYVWKSGEIIVESEGSKTFTESDLKEYTFTETEVENIYTISYELNGGTIDSGNPTQYKYSEDVVIPKTPTQDGFTFKGWYLAPDEVNPLGATGWEAGKMTGDVTLYADWHITDKTLDSNYTWEQISLISSGGEASKYFDVGETKKVRLIDQNFDHTVRIIGFNHDDLANGCGKAGITFEFANVITKIDGSPDRTNWNVKDGKSSTNYKYSNSTLNDFLNVGGDSIFNKLPDDLKTSDMIKEVYKPVAETESYEINDAYTTKLFPLSYREITENGEASRAKEEGFTYTFYTGSGDTNTNRIKNIVGGSSTYYWLRSPDTTYKTNANRIFNDGGLNSANILDYKYSVAPAFCI